MAISHHRHLITKHPFPDVSAGTDEFALLFTGSHAPIAQVQVHTHESPEAEESGGGGGGNSVEDDSTDVPTPCRDPPSTLDSADLSMYPIHPSLRDSAPLGLAHPLFTIEQLGVDRRLLVNRKRQLKMYRIWMQGKFRRTERDGSLTVGVAEPCDSPPY